MSFFLVFYLKMFDIAGEFRGKVRSLGECVPWT